MARRHSVLLTGALVMTGSLATTLPADAADNGLFAPYVAYDPGGDAASVAIGDVTGDLLDDVVLTTDRADDPTHAYSVWVYPQQADGSLGDPLQTATTGGAGSPMAVALADLDEDGDLDAAVTTDAGVDLLKQVDGRLVYEWSAWAEGGTDLELADVNGDDLADLVVNTPGGVVVQWQIFGDFMSAEPDRLVTTYPVTEVEVGDVTGDGLNDIVTALGRTVEVRAQLADHSFAPPTSYLSGGVPGWETVEGLALGDTNGDGRLDVHVSGGGNSPDSWVTSLVQLSDGTLAKPARYSSYDLPTTLESDDVTGDGRADLVVLHDSWNALGVYDSTPGTMPVETRFPIPHGQHYSADALAIGDVSGDGRADVAIADPQNGLVLLRGAPPGSDVYPPETTLVSGPYGTIYTRTATFTMSASEPATYQCSLDGSAWSGCGSSKTYQGLTAGEHSFRVRAVDPSGNVDQTPVWRPFNVDGPVTSIDSGPTGSIRSTTATFTFSATPAAASFDCSLDATTWTPCTSPVTYGGLSHGLRPLLPGARGVGGRAGGQYAGTAVVHGRPGGRPRRDDDRRAQPGQEGRHPHLDRRGPQPRPWQGDRARARPGTARGRHPRVGHACRDHLHTDLVPTVRRGRAVRAGHPAAGKHLADHREDHGHGDEGQLDLLGGHQGGHLGSRERQRRRERDGQDRERAVTRRRCGSVRVISCGDALTRPRRRHRGARSRRQPSPAGRRAARARSRRGRRTPRHGVR